MPVLRIAPGTCWHQFKKILRSPGPRPTSRRAKTSCTLNPHAEKFRGGVRPADLHNHRGAVGCQLVSEGGSCWGWWGSAVLRAGHGTCHLGVIELKTVFFVCSSTDGVAG